jgi:pimeloyl-ACP methyl ester carboxylesterase
MEVPEVRYVQTGDGVNVAYQVFGEGAVDLVFVWGWVSNLDLIWDEPRSARFLHRLGSFCRVISFDKRGTGLSDPVAVDNPPHVETRLDDLLAVVDAAGCQRAAVLGFSEGGATAVMFAAAHPDRVSSLVLYGAFPRVAWAEDYPWGETREQSLRRWVTPLMSGELPPPEELFPDGAQDPATRRWMRRYLLNSASPAMALALLRMNSRLDVRDILPAVRVPTLLLHRTGDVAVPVEHARYMAERIHGATLVEYPGIDHWPWFGTDVSDDVLRRIEGHVTGSVSAPPPDQVLATVLFVDIVGSTRQLAEVGDRDWQASWSTFRDIASSAVEQAHGDLIKWTGDGILATFAAPGRAVRCASTIVGEVDRLGLQVRCGLHTGEIQRTNDDVAGITVHTAARIGDTARPGEVLVSQTVVDIVSGSGLQFHDSGEHNLAGIPRSWRLHTLDGTASS